ncbi:restriction endonuclease [Desulfosporosinus sp. Tol-M]|nr:restriction endonuclease [Desulfosporosinus sp. Tol-M]
MNAKIDLALNMFYQRQISTREQLLNEMLRIKMVRKNLADDTNIITDKEKLFQFMKKTTEDELGFFPADRDDFFNIFQILKDIDLIDFTLEIYKNDRSGKVISPLYLNRYIREKIRQLQSEKILITEAEKHLSELRELIKQSPDSKLTLTTQLKPMNLLLKLAFGENPNVTIRFESIYTDCLQNARFDYIYSLPTFSYKPDELGRTFITRDSDGVALENMLGHLNAPGTLDIIVPAKITFAGLEYEKLRSYITDNFSVKNIYILPEGTFRPVTAIKTYFFTITTGPQNNVEIGTINLNKNEFRVTDKKMIPTWEFLAHADWRIELLLSEDDENIQRFKNSNLEKVKLKEVAEVFRGKSILKKNTTPGSISVLNISNIENGEINYADMDTIEEDERKVKRYELLNGDVVLSCRGTAIKTAVFEAQNKTIIASANLIVIRPKEKVSGEYIKIFLESPIGLAIIKSFQRGTTIMNINHADIMEMEIPLLPIEEQKEMVANYKKELATYKKTIGEAENRWTKIKDNLYNKLT